MNEVPIRQSDEGILLPVHLQPGAKKTELAGRHGDALKIKVQAPPVEGAANDAAIRFLAKTLGVSRSRVELIRGHKSREKSFCIQGISLDEAKAKLGFE